MKIVQISAVYGYSSTGRNVSEMHEFFRQQGIESFVFTSDKENINNYVYRVGGKWDHKFHALYSRIWGLQGYFSKGATREMIRRIEQITPDVVVLHNLHANYIHLPLLLDLHAQWPLEGRDGVSRRTFLPAFRSLSRLPFPGGRKG